MLYSAVDARLTRYFIDHAAPGLTKQETIIAPAKVQYVWPHPSLAVLYAATSSSGPREASAHNHVTAYRIASNGSLIPQGESGHLPRRAVHLCVDPTGGYVLSGHNFPNGGMTVHSLGAAGEVEAVVAQSATLDFGIYPHQVRMFPSGRTALIVDRGHAAHGDSPEFPGALRTFGFERGVLSSGQVVAPNGGYGFGPRHVDFHPVKPWMYVSDERMNRLYMFSFANDDRLEAAPRYELGTLADPQNAPRRQIAGPIHLHPGGRYVYVANRADASVDFQGRPVFAGGENSIAVFSIDERTGEPRLVQHAPTHAIHVRTFACDPSGQLLVAGSIKRHAERVGDEVREVPAALSLFRIGGDGRLDFVRRYEVEVDGSQMQYWMGIVASPTM